MPPLSNLATRDVETLVHPYINLASFRETGPLADREADERMEEFVRPVGAIAE